LGVNQELCALKRWREKCQSKKNAIFWQKIHIYRLNKLRTEVFLFFLHFFTFYVCIFDDGFIISSVYIVNQVEELTSTCIDCIDLLRQKKRVRFIFCGLQSG